MTQRIRGPPKGISVLVFVVQMFALLGVTLLFFWIIKPTFLDTGIINVLYFYVGLVVTWAIVYVCIAVVGKAAKTSLYMG